MFSRRKVISFREGGNITYKQSLTEIDTNAKQHLVEVRQHILTFTKYKAYLKHQDDKNKVST